MDTHTPTLAPSRRAWRVRDFCREFGISKSTFYNYRADGRLSTVRIAGVRLVPAEAAEEFLRSGSK
jgi:hypothetical protein